MQHNFAKNKALEQKLIGPMEESHTKQQSPKAVCEWSFEQGDRKWQQSELELMLELDGDFFERNKKCVGARISGGWYHGPTRQGVRPGPSWPGACSPCFVLGARYSQIFQKKSYFNFRAFGELLFSGYFYIARIIQKTGRKYYFYFISTK